ncbi:hypothetical Protein YC6258_02627 [Gynuella sunshinyii YC6258]|uniref:Uncharacterized protein n=1 Tax=Gynuella sunshinyii YC6258 TaxID=1445510 RepID=A0A0C5V5E9_9GAMM|nr:hypothetical Protein YC6258_02627 [Gynuella sunshinyii YC6258]
MIVLVYTELSADSGRGYHFLLVFIKKGHYAPFYNHYSGFSLL